MSSNLSGRKQGLHFYINIENFNDVIEKEEENNGVKHSIHALDNYFSAIEAYSLKRFSDILTVEKITGSRLHMFIDSDIETAYNAVAKISSYAWHLSGHLNSSTPKYKTLLDFKIQIGACYGDFRVFEFGYSDAKDCYEEMTTIGYACNFAAKLQSVTGVSKISISKDIYDAIDIEQRKAFRWKTSSAVAKYNQDGYYEAFLYDITPAAELTDALVRDFADRVNKRNLSSVSFSEPRQQISFKDLSITNGKQLQGIPVFADIRDFTSQFEEDDSNLDEMSQKTENVLLAMYRTTVKHKGIHVQFQGDRELALFHNYGNTLCYKDAVLSAMRMIDEVKPYTVHIGVGEAFGRMYAVKIGARGNKDNLLIGRTVNEADRLEDEYAGEDQLAISEDVFRGLKQQDSTLAEQFIKRGNHYITTKGYQEYSKKIQTSYHIKETKEHKYNGAWGL